MRVRLEVSAHHCHVTRQDVDVLFGASYRLRQLRQISQPGQFASKDVVRIKVGRGEILARIVGPERPRTQVEISLSEALKLGVHPPVTYFGESSKPRVSCQLIGPKGRVRRRAVIIAQRHIHCDPRTAKRLKLHNRHVVSVRTAGPRPVTFHGVVVRVHPKFRFRCHLDTDEGNAAGLATGDWGVVVKANSARLKR